MTDTTALDTQKDDGSYYVWKHCLSIDGTIPDGESYPVIDEDAYKRAYIQPYFTEKPDSTYYSPRGTIMRMYPIPDDLTQETTQPLPQTDSYDGLSFLEVGYTLASVKGISIGAVFEPFSNSNRDLEARNMAGQWDGTTPEDPTYGYWWDLTVTDGFGIPQWPTAPADFSSTTDNIPIATAKVSGANADGTTYRNVGTESRGTFYSSQPYGDQTRETELLKSLLTFKVTA